MKNLKNVVIEIGYSIYRGWISFTGIEDSVLTALPNVIQQYFLILLSLSFDFFNESHLDPFGSISE